MRQPHVIVTKLTHPASTKPRKSVNGNHQNCQQNHESLSSVSETTLLVSLSVKPRKKHLRQ